MQALCLLIETSLLFFYLPSLTLSCKSSIQMSFSFCLYCGFSKHYSGYVCIDLSPITGARKVCATMELPAEKTSCRSSEKYIVIIITTIAPKKYNTSLV